MPYQSALPGPTPSTPVNVGVGATVLAGSNALTVSSQGADIAGLAAGVTMIFQWLKQFDWFHQHSWAPLVLVLLGITLTAIYLALAHKELADAIPKGMWVAWQAFENYIGQRATGLGGLNPATGG